MVENKFKPIFINISVKRKYELKRLETTTARNVNNKQFIKPVSVQMRKTSFSSNAYALVKCRFFR